MFSLYSALKCSIALLIPGFLKIIFNVVGSLVMELINTSSSD